MSEETKVIEKKEENITTPPAGTVSTEATDTEARIAAIEIEKENYRIAYLKEKNKRKPEDGEETEDEKIERIVNEKLAVTKIAQLDSEREALFQKTLKENKELKLAQLNKTTTPTSMGTHSESTPVTDTAVTPDQMAVFKAKGWSDKDIERYKRNLNKYGGR